MTGKVGRVSPLRAVGYCNRSPGALGQMRPTTG